MRRTITSSLLLLLFAGAAAVTHAQEELELLDLGDGIEGNAFFSPYEELDKKVMAVLDMAEPGSTVYQSYYSLSYQPYFWKYRELVDRGVSVKVNLWNGSFKDYVDGKLQSAGVDNAWIMNIRRPPPENWSSMHTKITVVNEEWVISGSANLSNSASLANHEHIVVLRSPEIAREFIREFEEQRAADAVMRDYEGEIDGEEDEDYAEMMERLEPIDVRTDNQSDEVRTYFSPDDWPKYRVVDEIRAAEDNIKIAMYTFFQPTIAHALREASERGVRVIALLDAHQHQHNEFAEFTLDILREGQDIEIYLADTQDHDKRLGKYASLHHKYAVIDDETVIGGSFNWTGTAHHYNDENMMVVRSEALAARFNRDFATLLQRYHPETLRDLQDEGLVASDFDGPTTRVLFAVRYNGTDPEGNDLWDYRTSQELVVVGNVPALGDGDPAKGLVLRGSRSVSPQLLGSVDLPRGKRIEWRVCVRDKDSDGISDVLNGDTVTGIGDRVEVAARDLTVDASGASMIVGPVRPGDLTEEGVTWGEPSDAPAPEPASDGPELVEVPDLDLGSTVDLPLGGN